MDPTLENNITQYVLENVQAESLLNREGNVLPFGYFNPRTDGKLIWICGQDPEGQIVSVFCYDFGTYKEKKCDLIPSIEKAMEIREELIKDGWQKLKPPEVTFSYAGKQGEKKKLNREQRRFLERKIKQLKRRNPFASDSFRNDNSTSNMNNKQPGNENNELEGGNDESEGGNNEPEGGNDDDENMEEDDEMDNA